MRLPPRAVLDSGRRAFVGAAGAAAVLLAGCWGDQTRAAEGAKPEVTPGEDLMQEHGVLERVLLVYGEVGRRIDQGQDVDPAVAARGAALVRHFIEDYHERNEERYLFPRIAHDQRVGDLVTVLQRQHLRGRALTDDIVRLAAAGPTSALARTMRDFERMYRPHAAREDTVLFPAFRALLGREAYHELGERLEEEERRTVGPNGFAEAVATVDRLEQELGIHDLAAFTA